MFDAGTVWMDKLDGPDTSFTNALVPIVGSAWIDWAPAGTGWMDFSNYSVYYQLQGNSSWTNIVKDSMQELHHAVVANWNTQGLTAGNYLLKLTAKNIYGDSVEAMRPITLLLGTGIPKIEEEMSIFAFPNPSHNLVVVQLKNASGNSLALYNAIGQRIFFEKILPNTSSVQLNLTGLANGIYFLRLDGTSEVLRIEKTD
jgi:hypothetical protein